MKIHNASIGGCRPESFRADACRRLRPAMKWLSFLPLPLTVGAMLVAGLARAEGVLAVAVFAFVWALYYSVALGLFWLLPISLLKRIVAAAVAPLIVTLLLMFISLGTGGFLPVPAGLG